MFEAERSYCRKGLSQAIAARDLDAASDWLSALQEFQVDTYGEQTVLGTLVTERDLRRLFDSGDPVDELEGGMS